MKCSKIVLALLEAGEAYIVDMRKEYRGRAELVEVLEIPAEGSGEEHVQRWVD